MDDQEWGGGGDIYIYHPIIQRSTHPEQELGTEGQGIHFALVVFPRRLPFYHPLMLLLHEMQCVHICKQYIETETEKQQDEKSRSFEAKPCG